MKLLLWAGVFCVAIGAGSIAWALWTVQYSRSAGIGAVAGGVGPAALFLLLGVLIFAVAGIVRLMRR